MKETIKTFLRKNVVKIANDIRRKKNIYEDVTSNVIASFPYVSGDTFKCISDFTYQENDVIKKSQTTTGNESIIIFIDLNKLESEYSRNLFLEFISNFKKSDLRMVFHNGDKIPEREFFERLKDYSSKIYSVNVTDEYDGIIQIPIGIENYRLGVNGILGPLKNHCISKRTIEIYSPFSLLTNQQARGDLLKKIENSRHSYSGIKNRKKYLNDLNKSKLVLSPPGSGLDCHRTWEAMYMNAVPVVIKGTLTKDFVRHYPILEVDNWGDVLNLTSSEIDVVYSKVRKINSDRAYMNFWIKELYR